MRKIYIIALAVISAFSSGCGKGGAGGELVGVKTKKVSSSRVPYGMVYVPAGTFVMGQTDQDITYAQIAQNKQVTVQAFYMDETEITNSEYKQFVHWVRDSIAITDYLQDPKFYIQPKGKGASADAGGQKYIDWRKVGDGAAIWADKKNAGSANKLQAMYYQGEDRVFDRNEIDVRLLKYNFAILNLREAANNRGNKNKRRSDFIFRDTVAIYPDTLVWLADFAYAGNDPMTEGYFSHPSYANYPVVGVTWRQARAFTVWRTRLYEGSAQGQRNPRLPFELPTEAEFEYAARGGRIGTDYPWGGPYIRNAKGCLMANFKPGRGNYNDDGGAVTVNVRSYYPNDFGLYNMAGNVAEWTSSAYDESASTFVHDLNPTFSYEAKGTDAEVMKRKVVRGGSWKDIGYFLQNSTRAFEYQDTAKSYIGFRCVTRFPGRDIRDRNSF
ncbi:T9SS ring complex lipoprotein PorK/GldK [Pararcticibacter amylolyticus]|uniref:Gliding motility-associated lipoprotein n=1 Tax=Pararcticibacter amylolyticus TaxID=2173175 RepID=A0A2U2PBK5_9SPHI|nr:SUMF1/EgtB/PvdO family nonheme iron enzyme [Pararcticibacter amylolyticus]PWG78777.1 gliding motility-associated lipoprotein [Pararcticibacter amylolyticus]